MKSTFFYIGGGTFVTIASILLVQLVFRCHGNPSFWMIIASVELLVSIILSVNILVYSRRLSPKTTWLPPPFKF